MFLGWVCVLALTSFAYQDSNGDPTRAASLNERAIELLEAGDIEGALPLLREATALWPANRTVRNNLAYAIFQSGKAALDGDAFEEARAAFLEARGLDPSEPLYAFFVGYTHYRESRYDLARQELSSTIERFPDDPKTARAHEFLGDVDYREGELPATIEHWERALTLESDNEPLRARLAKAKRELEVEGEFFLDSSVHFDIRYEGISEQYEHRDEILELLENAHLSIGRELDHFPEARTQVILYTQSDFAQVTNSHGWVGGLFDGKIRLPVKNFRRERSRIQSTLRHEYVHVVVQSLTDRCPVWLNEGLAQLAEGGSVTSAHAHLREVVGRGAALPTPSDIPRSFTGIADANRVRLLYAWSESFTEFLKRSYGQGALAQVLHRLRERPFETAVYDVYQRSVDELFQDWVGQLEH